MADDKIYKKLIVPGSAKTIEDTDTLWRYMSFAKFCSIVLTNTIYFARLDLFSDEHEGRTTSDVKKNIESTLSNQLAGMPFKDTISKSINNALHKDEDNIRCLYFVSCWNKLKYENYNLWESYARSNESVAIKTQFGELAKAIPTNFTIGAVEYIDFRAPPAIAELQFTRDYRPLFKRNNFEAENEVRLFHIHHKTQGSRGEITISSTATDIDLKKDQPSGLEIPLRLEKLKHEIILPKRAPLYIQKNIEMLYKMRSLSANISRSDVF